VVPAPLDYRLFADPAQATEIDSGYSFGLIQGGDIRIEAAQAAADDPRIDLSAFTNHGDAGQIEVLLNGDITLTETHGDYRLHSVRSTVGDIDLGTAAGDIEVIRVEASAGDVTLTARGAASRLYESGTPDNGATAFVIGNSVTLLAPGGIGSAADFFEIDSSNQAPGVVRAIADSSIFLTETAGDLVLDGVSSNHADVSLLTLSGSIVDGIVEAGGDLADIQGRDVDLIVNGGGIGSVDNDVEIHGAGIDFSTTFGADLLIKLSTHDDDLRVHAVNPEIAAYVYGGAGNDTLTVANAQDRLDDIEGIVAFFGEAGSDTLEVRGDASVDEGVLSAISVTGMGMGRNALVATHNDVFGAGYEVLAADWPAAIYFAVNDEIDGVQAYRSTVEAVNVRLGDGNNTFRIDSAYDQGVSHVYGGSGDDVLTVGSTPFGLNPNSLRRVDFIRGDLRLHGGGGNDTVVVDDSGDDNADVGQVSGAVVSGLDMLGSVTSFDIDTLQINLGAQGDSFYVPATSTDFVTVVDAGGGFDRVWVGTTAGNETSGSLDAVQGVLRLVGNDPDAEDELFFNDQSSTAAQTFVVNNVLGPVVTLPGGQPWRFDTTTVERTGMRAVEYAGFEAVVLNAGQGADQINIWATHREQATDGKNATFTVNAGPGDDHIVVGAPKNGGFTLAGFAIDTTSPDENSTRGIPVMVNGQAGYDTVQFNDSASTVDTDLAFVNKSFANIFPTPAPGDPTLPNPEWVSRFTRYFGDEPVAATYHTVVLSETGTNRPLNVNSRDTENVQAVLGSGDDVIQLVSGRFAVDLTVYAGAGDDTFNIEGAFANTGHTVTLHGDDGDDTVYAQFEDAVPAGTIDLVFNGGPQHGGLGGDKLRIAGDGRASGSYTPSTSVARAGELLVGGNHFSFTGVEPLVVHGLNAFTVATSDDPALLAIDSIDVADLNLPNLVLHVVTIDGVTSWTQQAKLVTPEVADSKHTGKAVAISGNTLVVGSEIERSASGVVYVYVWNGSGWTEQAKLYASDRGAGGQGFGDAVAIDGNLLIVGAPKDNTFGTDSGAAYVFVRDGNGIWRQETKLKAADGAAGATFGQSVSISGSIAFVGAAGGNADAVYAFTRSGSNWSQTKIARGVDDFGAAVAVAGSTVVVGAPLADAFGADTGAAYVYQRNGSLWTLQTTLSPSNPDPGENFGAAVDIDPGRIVVGAPRWDGVGIGFGGQNEQGRVFVFEGGGNAWTRVARLTQNGGLPEAEALIEAQAGSRFGWSVALDGDSVVVGAPFHDSKGGPQNNQAQDSGAAYVFYRLPDLGSGLGASWARASGPSGPGRLQAASPAASDPPLGDPLLDQYRTADRFGSAVAVGGGRIVVGLPGYNETRAGDGVVIRGDVGAVRTFSSNGQRPEPGNDAMRADVLRDPSGVDIVASRFGALTHYDAASRTLLVGDPGQNRVHVYINEGLYWRPVQTLVGDVGWAFGTSFDIDGQRLVVGSPGIDHAFIYTRSGEQWSWAQSIAGATGSGFGTSVAVSGSRIVVGMPTAGGWYRSWDQADPNYLLPLGNPGAALVFTFNGSSFVQDRLLMPDDNALWLKTSEFVQTVPAGWNQVTLSGKGTYGIGGHTINEGNGTSITLGPWTGAFLIDYTGGDYYWASRYNYSDNPVTASIPSGMNDDVEFMMVVSLKDAAYARSCATTAAAFGASVPATTSATTAATVPTRCTSAWPAQALAFDWNGGDRGFVWASGSYPAGRVVNFGGDAGFMRDDVDVFFVGSNSAGDADHHHLPHLPAARRQPVGLVGRHRRQYGGRRRAEQGPRRRLRPGPQRLRQLAGQPGRLHRHAAARCLLQRWQRPPGQ
jgi:hypothetical protein